MDPRLDAQLRDALVQFLRGEGLIQEASRLPVVASQAVQSGQGAPVPQQTLGPQPGEPRPVSRQQWMNDFGQAAGSFAASAADPLNIPSALLGVVAPGARDWWRQYAAAAGPEVQLAGGLASGFGTANAMLRGGRAAAGIPGAIAGGAATGAGPAIDYFAGAPGANSLAPGGAQALLGGVLAGQGAGIGNAMRPYLPTAIGAGGLGLLAASGMSEDSAAFAQQKGQPAQKKAATPTPVPAADAATDPQIQRLHETNPALRTLFDRIAEARRQRDTAEARARRMGGDNEEANGQARRAGDVLTRAQEAYDRALREASASSLPWDQAYPNLSQNYSAVQFLGPAALGYAVRGAGNSLMNAYTRPWRGAVANAENNLSRVVSAGPGTAAERQAMGNAMLATNTANQYLNQAGNGPTAFYNSANLVNQVMPVAAGATLGAELALFPHQHNRRLPVGTPERTAADAATGTPMNWLGTALQGASVGALGGVTGSHLPFAPMFGRQIPAPVERTRALRGLTTGDAAPEMNQLAANINAMRPPAIPAPQQQRPALPAPENPQPPVAPPAQPPTSNLPVDYESIIRDIGGGRNVRGPRGSNPAAPGLSYAPSMDSAAQFRTEIADHLRSGNVLSGFNVSEFRRRAVQAAEAGGGGATDVPSVEVFRRTLQRLESLIREQGLSPAQAAQRLSRENRRGGFENFAIPLAAGGAAAAHHSTSQPRGDDGRFQTVQ